MNPQTLAGLSLALGALLSWLSWRLVLSYVREGWPQHAFAAACLFLGAGVCLSLFLGEAWPL